SKQTNLNPSSTEIFTSDLFFFAYYGGLVDQFIAIAVLIGEPGGCGGGFFGYFAGGLQFNLFDPVKIPRCKGFCFTPELILIIERRFFQVGFIFGTGLIDLTLVFLIL